MNFIAITGIGCRLTGMLDTQRLRGAIQAVTDASDALRTCFGMEDDRPVQHVRDLVQAPDGIGLPLVGPAGMPAEVAAVLRQAFLAMAADKDYQADAERVDLPVGQPIEGSRIAEMIGALATVATPPVIAEFNRLAGVK